VRTSFHHQSEAQPPNGPLTAATSPDTPSTCPATQSVLSKQPDKDTKPFAQKMVTDHQKTSKELNSLVEGGKVKATLPSALDSEHQKMLDDLKMLFVHSSGVGRGSCLWTQAHARKLPQVFRRQLPFSALGREFNACTM
jgi:hypothetical protein